MDLGSWIAVLRERAGLNQSELGRAVGVSPQAVQHWEKGGGIRPAKFDAIAAALGVSKAVLLLGDDYGPSQPVGLDVAKLADLLGTVEAAVQRAGVALTPQAKARLIASLYVDEEASAAASAQAVQAALVSILATMERSDEPDAAR